MSIWGEGGGVNPRRLIGAAAVALVVLVAIAAGFVSDYSGDFHWHIAVGDYMIEHLRLYSRDVHSHTYAGEPVFISAWLSDVLLATAFKLGGTIGCYALRAAAITGMSGFLLLEATGRGVRATTAAALVLLLLAQSLFLLYMRPDTFAFALLAAMVYVLGQHERTGRSRFLIIALAIILVWPNIHGSVGVGLLGVGLYCAERVLRELALGRGRWNRNRLAWALMMPPVAFALACVNPEGISLPLAFRIVDDTWATTIREWLPLSLSAMPTTAHVALAAVGATTAAALWMRRLPAPWLVIYTLALWALTLRFGRFVTYAAIATVPLVAANLAALRDGLGDRPRLRHLGACLAAVVALWAGVILGLDRQIHKQVGLHVDEEAAVYPAAACEFVRAQGAPGPMFNSYELGSFLMHCLGTDYPVFIDGRAWSLYDSAFYSRYRQSAESAQSFRELLRDYPSSWAVVLYDPLAARLALQPESWRLVYFDDKVLVYANLHDSRMTQIVAQHGMQLLDPARLAQLPDLRPEGMAAATRELAIQREHCADCYRTVLAEAAVAIAEGNNDAFERARDSLLRRRETQELAFLAARFELGRGDRRAAAVLFQRFVDLGGDPRVPAHFLGRSR